MSASDDKLWKVATYGRIVGQKEDQLESMSHLRVYPSRPGKYSLQLRTMAREGIHGQRPRQVLVTASLCYTELRQLRDHLDTILAVEDAEGRDS